MLENRRAVGFIVSAAKELQKAAKNSNFEVSEMHLIDSLKHIVRAMDSIMPMGGEDGE